LNSNDKNICERIILKRVVESCDIGMLSGIYEEHKPFLNKYLANLVHLDGYAEDLTHDIFLAISRGKCSYTGDIDVRGYLCGVAKILALSSNRKEAKQGIIFTDCLSDEISQAESGEPTEKLNLEEIRVMVNHAISNLPEASRHAVELVLVHNLRPYQAAKKLDCSLDTLRKRLKRGQIKLRKELKKLSKNFAF
jgi:RNA polymerase sigma-70 factor (ECF subfamily)